MAVPNASMLKAITVSPSVRVDQQDTPCVPTLAEVQGQHLDFKR